MTSFKIQFNWKAVQCCSFPLTSSALDTLCLKAEEELSDGRWILPFHNSTKKEISADERMAMISFSNGDVKKIVPDQRVLGNF